MLRRGWQWAPAFGFAQMATGVTTLAAMATFLRLYEAGALGGTNLAASLVAIFPAALAMGVAFPIGVRAWTGAHDDEDDVAASRVATLYAANVGGAIAGAVSAGFVLLPLLGSRGSLIALASVLVLVLSGIQWGAAQRRELIYFHLTLEKPVSDYFREARASRQLYSRLAFAAFILASHDLLLLVRSLEGWRLNTYATSDTAIHWLWVLGLALLAYAVLYPTYARRLSLPWLTGASAGVAVIGLGVSVLSLLRPEYAGVDTTAGQLSIVGARIVTARGSAFEGTFQPGDGEGISLRRLHLDAMLLKEAEHAGVCVLEGTSFRGFTRTGGIMEVAGRRNGEETSTRCRVLIGADGSHSAVARAMGVVRPIRCLQKVAFVTHTSSIEGIGDRVEMHAGYDGCVGIGPGPGGEANLTVLVSPAAARAVKDIPEAVRRTVEAYPGLRGRFDAASWDPQVLRVGTYGHTVTRAVGDGIALVGDSATFIDPFTGEGVYFALRGAEMAADRIDAALRSGEASLSALIPYDRDRRVEFSRKYALCGLVERVVSHPMALGWFASRLRKSPELADDLIRTTGDILAPGRIFSAPFWSRLVCG
jgi:flavin-dependent dehydrogenase